MESLELNEYVNNGEVFVRLLYEELFGGIEMFTAKHYQLINGFSNAFWGWGAEDDNLYRRYRYKHYLIVLKL